jgi:hypothetical protein
VGDDAAMVIPTWHSHDDAAFESLMRTTLNLDW